MTVPRIWFLAHQISPGSLLVVDARQLHYLRNVLRVRVGHVVFVTDAENRRWISHVVDMDHGFALLVEGPAMIQEQMPVQIGVLLALLKAGHMEWGVQKAVECGASDLVLFGAHRSVVRTPAGSAKAGRFARVAQEAARQCGRDHVPVVKICKDLSEALPHVQGESRILLDEREQQCMLPQVLQECRGQPQVWLAIGPEGSFTDREYAMLLDAGFVSAGLGPRILRAETAAVAAVLAVQLILGDMGGANG